MVYINTINFVLTTDNEDFTEVVSISPFPGVFGYVKVHEIHYMSQIDQPIYTIQIPIQLPLKIGNKTITLNKLLITDIYLSSSDSTGKMVAFYSEPMNKANLYEASVIFYEQGELHGTYFFVNTINIIVEPSAYPTDLYLNMFGLYYIGNELLLYK